MTRPLLLLTAATLCLGACKPSVPETFDGLVPTEHRDALTKVIEESADLKEPGRDYLILWYGKEAVDRPTLYAAFRSQLEARGYGLMVECEGDDPASMTLAKAPNEAVSVTFRDLKTDIWFTDVERVQVATIGLPLDQEDECHFTEHATALCKSISGSSCFMTEL